MRGDDSEHVAAQGRAKPREFLIDRDGVWHYQAQRRVPRLSLTSATGQPEYQLCSGGQCRSLSGLSHEKHAPARFQSQMLVNSVPTKVPPATASTPKVRTPATEMTTFTP